MTGLVPMLRKEGIEIVRTWRGWLMLGIFGLFGIIDPILARFMKQIIGAAVGDQMPIQVPDPTWLDAWGQWTKDLSQLLIVIVVVVAAAAVAGEISSGTAIMPLTKPLDRSAFVLAKYIAVLALVAISVALGSGFASAATAIAFPGAEFAPGWRAVAVWLVLAAFICALTILGSALVGNTVAAFGIGFGGYMVLSMVAIWQPAKAYSPAGLPEAIGLLARGQDADLAWPIGTAVLATIVLLGLAILAFRRREL